MSKTLAILVCVITSGGPDLTKEQLLIVVKAAREALSPLELWFDYIPTSKGLVGSAVRVRVMRKRSMLRYEYFRLDRPSPTFPQEELRISMGRSLLYEPAKRVATIGVDEGMSQRDGIGGLYFDLGLLEEPRQNVKGDSLESILGSELTTVSKGGILLNGSPHARVEFRLPERPYPTHVVMLDTDRGWSVTEHHVTDETSGKILARYQVTQKLEVSPGVWLPVHGLCRVYTDDIATEWIIRVVEDSEWPSGYRIRVKSDLPDRLFSTDALSLPIGTRVLDEIAAKRYTIGPEKAEKVEELLESSAHPSALAVQPPRTVYKGAEDHRSRVLLYWLALMLGGAAVGLLLVGVFKRRSRRGGRC